MTVVQSKWVLSQGCPQLPIIRTANGAVFTANLGTVSRYFWRIANFEQTLFHQSSECRTERTAWAICYKRRTATPNGLLARDNDTVTMPYNLWVMLPAVPYYTWKSGCTSVVDFIYPSRRKYADSTRFTVAETCHFLWEITTLKIKPALSCKLSCRPWAFHRE
jgi:hypothetical protein